MHGIVRGTEFAEPGFEGRDTLAGARERGARRLEGPSGNRLAREALVALRSQRVMGGVQVANPGVEVRHVLPDPLEFGARRVVAHPALGLDAGRVVLERSVGAFQCPHAPHQGLEEARHPRPPPWPGARDDEELVDARERVGGNGLEHLRRHVDRRPLAAPSRRCPAPP